MTSDLLVPRPELTGDPSVDLAIARLEAEFRDRLERQFIRRTVQTCRTDLSGVPVDAIPELVERLARHRLASV
ncbi:hypothetical protein OF117_19770 [Geodermatophilus sp. YIM 151500]|uniref:three-helix bundle dimerization domain-containing protein n=1 Tax=Geodermatophilus sp. YIM 151500 TaxID=2984531 RepID=UPI0021E4F797|nr:hypothetical protein [Geodermatophilus sp. YIM 151500]MCV2491588.1 hypothetical protein [Geodermatophilus sp. YIM 151500]